MANTTKRKLVEKAERSLWQNGYDGTSINALVADAGVSKGAFFHHYPNKRAIILDVLDKYAQDRIFAPLEARADRESVKESLFSWIESIFRDYEQADFKSGCLLGNSALELSDEDEAIRERIRDIVLQWENRLVNLLKPLAAEDKLLMEPRQLARLLIAAVEGTVLTSKVHKDSIRASREFQALFQLIELMIKD
ncbi:MAG: TetR/AcrR family transcriptional regulator [Alphaproteobacteria bacterium]